MMSLSRRSVAGLPRRARRRDHRFRPGGLEACEPRLVLDGGAGSLAFAFTSHGAFVTPNAPGILSASVPSQHGNEICATYYNNTGSPQTVTTDLFYDPNHDLPPVQAGQTLAYTQTMVVAADSTAEVCFVVAPGQCYQIDTRPGSIPATLGGSTTPGTPLSPLNNALSGARFCVPEGQNNGCFIPGYYRDHPDVIASLLNMLPGDQLVVGTMSYTADQLITILQMKPAGGDSRMILAHQLITAELNLLNGCSPNVTDLYEINLGNSLLSGVDLLNLQGIVHDSTMTSVADYLDNFNNPASHGRTRGRSR